MPNGVHIPEGTEVSCPQAAVAEDPQLWGEGSLIWTEDGPTFHPENWMKREGETEEEFENRRGIIERQELVFGQGSRICLGKNIASLEIYKILATLMLLFRVSSLLLFSRFKTNIRASLKLLASQRATKFSSRSRQPLYPVFSVRERPFHFRDRV